jgi:exosome complex component RRP41
VLVSVNGPQEARQRVGDKGVVVCRYVNSPFSGFDYKLRRGGDRRSQEIENIIKESYESVILLDLYGHSEIAITVHVLENDGSIMCSIFNAVTLALVDAGICMKDMIISCSSGFVRQTLCQDLIQIEQSAGGAYLPVAMLSKSNEIIYTQLESRLSVENLEIAIQEAVKGCGVIRRIMENGIKHSIEAAIVRGSVSM